VVSKSCLALVVATFEGPSSKILASRNGEKIKPSVRLKHKNTPKHESTPTPKLQIPDILAPEPKSMAQSRSRKNPAPAAWVVRRQADVLVPRISFLFGRIAPHRRKRDGGHAVRVI